MKKKIKIMYKEELKNEKKSKRIILKTENCMSRIRMVAINMVFMYVYKKNK